MIATGALVLLAGFAAPRSQDAASQDPFPELAPLTARAHARRGRVVLGGPDCDRAVLGIEPKGARARLVVRTDGGAPELVTDPETVVRLVPGSVELVDDRERLDALSDVETILFDEGSVTDWVRALYPRNRRTLLVAELWRRHDAGATVLGFGRAAAALGAVSPVEPAELVAIGRRPRNPRDASDDSSFWGLGFVPWALVDVAGTPDASIERWVDRAWRDRYRLAVWIPERGALIADVRAGCATARGPEPVLFLDLKPARRSRDWLLGGRLSTLRAGGRWEQEARRVRPTHPTVDATDPPGGAILEWTSPDVLAGELWRRVLEQFEEPSPPRAVRVTGNFFELCVSIDAETALYEVEDGLRLLDRLRIDLNERKTNGERH